MKKLLFVMTFAALLGMGGCAENGGEKPAPLAIDNALTADEKAEGKVDHPGQDHQEAGGTAAGQRHRHEGHGRCSFHHRHGALAGDRID